jgi:hypothetical protein
MALGQKVHENALYTSELLGSLRLSWQMTDREARRPLVDHTIEHRREVAMFKELFSGARSDRPMNSRRPWTQLKRILKRTGIQPWPQLSQNLRSTRKTKLTETFSTHVVCNLMDNSEIGRGSLSADHQCSLRKGGVADG